ncbi:hypothetical protein INT43_008008 [Umbelopsis isabellina]|uniref:Uncharacterized protein n=1 Tax=Mortierella isabellina TaxID=91625 RepID=A0A8H7U9I8_MORIS|nr:hypothetical protein INT43_008008 [Umbelopsis isabellina]
MPVFPSNCDPAYKKHFAENIKQHLPLPMIGNEFVKVYTRCRYWPRCSNRKCKFVHPVYECKLDKDCPYDTLCAFRHSTDPIPDNLTGYYRGRRKSKQHTGQLINDPKSPPKKPVVQSFEHRDWSQSTDSPQTRRMSRSPSPMSTDDSSRCSSPALTDFSDESTEPIPAVSAPKHELYFHNQSLLTHQANIKHAYMLPLIDALPSQRQEPKPPPFEPLFPCIVFLWHFWESRKRMSSNSLNFEDCGSLMWWSEFEENRVLGPNLTVASMKKIWQEVPNRVGDFII